MAQDESVIERMYNNMSNPENFFDKMSEEEFRFWLKHDEYCLPLEHVSKDSLLRMLDILDPFPQFDNLYKIVLDELSKTRDYENEQPKGD